MIDRADGLVSQLARERRALAATLRTVGPEAPTLIPGWTAHDIAAHVAATEQVRGVPTFLGRTLVERYGLRLNDTFKGTMSFDRRRFRRHGFEWAVRRIERDGPALLARRTVVAVGVFEVFVHHEDVRRANDVGRSESAPDVVPSIRWLLRYQRKLLGDISVRVALVDGRELRGGAGGDGEGDGPAITIRGESTEVLLWLAGRARAAGVDVEGDAATIALLALRLAV